VAKQDTDGKSRLFTPPHGLEDRRYPMLGHALSGGLHRGRGNGDEAGFLFGEIRFGWLFGS
jgi:hypothetical protein